MKSSIKLGCIFGIEIGAHFSWLFIIILMISSLSAHFAMLNANWSPAWQWSAVILAALLFFASVRTDISPLPLHWKIIAS